MRIPTGIRYAIHARRKLTAARRNLAAVSKHSREETPAYRRANQRVIDAEHATPRWLGGRLPADFGDFLLSGAANARVVTVAHDRPGRWKRGDRLCGVHLTGYSPGCEACREVTARRS